MFPRSCLLHPRFPTASRVLPAALMALLVAAMLLPLAPVAGAVDDDDPVIRPSARYLNVTTRAEAAETPAVDVDAPLLIDTEGVEVDVDDPLPPLAPTPAPALAIDLDRPLPDIDGPDVGGDVLFVGTILIDKWACPGGYDAYAATHDALLADCQTQPSGVVFELSDGSQVLQTQATSNTVAGGVAFYDVPAAPVSIAEYLPAAYGEPVVYCASSLAGDYQPRPVLDGVRIAYPLGPAETVWCDWFNVPLTYGEPIYVSINKYVCPEDAYDYADNHTSLTTACDEPMPDVTFVHEVVGFDQTVTTQQGETDVDGMLYFQQAAAGWTTITEIVPDGYGEPIVYCIKVIPGGPLVNAYKRVETSAAGISVEQFAGDQLVCDWYNVPGTFEGDEDPTGGDGSILVRKFVCPAGFDADNANHFDLAYACQDPMDGVAFLLADENGGTMTGTTGDAGTGAVEFASLPTPAAYVVLEQVPDGYGDPVVFCKDPIDENDAWERSSVAEGNQILEVLEAGHVLICDWFNVPSKDEGGTVTVVKLHCLTAFDPHTPLDDVPADCEALLDGVGFQLTVAGLYEDTRVTGEGGQDEGLAEWTDVPAGYLVIDEEIPSGYGTPAVWCSSTGSYNDLVKMEVEVDAIGLDYDGGDLICVWINIPIEDGDGTLTVVKYWCEGFVYDETACDEYTGGQEFTLVSQSGQGDPIVFTTGTDGTYQTTLPAGTWMLVEDDGGWCYVHSNRQHDPQPLPNPGFDGTTLVVEVDPGQQTTIEVFNCAPWGPNDPSDDPGDGGDGPSTPTKGPGKVTTLPSTGAAPVVVHGGQNSTLLVAQVVAALLIATGTAICFRSRR